MVASHLYAVLFCVTIIIPKPRQLSSGTRKIEPFHSGLPSTKTKLNTSLVLEGPSIRYFIIGIVNGLKLSLQNKRFSHFKNIFQLMSA